MVEKGSVLVVLTTTASMSEIVSLKEILVTIELPKYILLKADKGYQSKENLECFWLINDKIVYLQS